jgi:hypothetical protein
MQLYYGSTYCYRLQCTCMVIKNVNPYMGIDLQILVLCKQWRI